MLDELVGSKIIVDLSSPYVCLGTLQGFSEHFLQVRNADLHDLRDTDTTRENYIFEAQRTGIKRNRKKVLIVRSEIVAITLFEDLVDS